MTTNDKTMGGRRRAWSYEELAQRAAEASAIFAAKGVGLHPASTLAMAFKKARELTALANVLQDQHATLRLLKSVGNADRIAEAVIALCDDDDPETLSCLKRLTAKPADLESRVPSGGKDAFWEIDLLCRLRRRGVDVRLAEPDVVCDLSFGQYGIACRQNYSDSKAESQMKKGCEQIKNAGLKGLVAMNLDELAPADALLTSPNHELASEHLAGILLDFQSRHEAAMRRFVMERRCDGMLLTISAHFVGDTAKPQFDTLIESVIWTVAEAPNTARERLREVATLFPGIKAGAR